jgi:hypothetical protein
MKTGYKITGFSNETEELVFEIHIDEAEEFLKQLLEIPPNLRMVDTYIISNDKQKQYFSEKYGIVFDAENEYYVDAFQIS